MRQLSRLCFAAFASMVIAVAATAPATAAAKPPAKHKKPFTPDLCSIAGGAVSGAGVSAPCVKLKTAHVPVKSSPPGGTVGLVRYAAQWGKPTSTEAPPTHYAIVTVMHLLGSGKAFEIAKAGFRAKVLGNGAGVRVAGGDASVDLEPNACLNPPTGQCVEGTFLAVKGSWGITVILTDFPPTIPGSNENELTLVQDEAAARQTEEAMKPALSAIGKVVVAGV